MKDRKKPEAYRAGNLVKILDLFQRFANIRHEKDFYNTDVDQINKKYQDELEEMMMELRAFDITEIGNLYLTTGGRVVLDKGYGEYFSPEEQVFTLKEITSGIPLDKFNKGLNVQHNDKNIKGKIITLCGSTTFKDEYERVNKILTLQGNVVLSCGVFDGLYPNPEKHLKLMQDIHKRKIDLSEGIVVINVGGYIGEHTREEINYAMDKNKKIIYLENKDGIKLF